jgi:hypothetical protein
MPISKKRRAVEKMLNQNMLANSKTRYDVINYAQILTQRLWSLTDANSYVHDLCAGDRRQFGRHKYGFGSDYEQGSDLALADALGAIDDGSLNCIVGADGIIRVRPRIFCIWASRSMGWKLSPELEKFISEEPTDSVSSKNSSRQYTRQSDIHKEQALKLAQERRQIYPNHNVAQVVAYIQTKLKKHGEERYNARTIRDWIRPRFPSKLRRGKAASSTGL